MNNNSDFPSALDLSIDGNFNFKKSFFKYFYYWKVFLISVLLFVFASYLVLRYTSKSFESTAKILILDKKQSSLDLPTVEDLFSNSKIILDNEIAVLTSYPILRQVVEDLNLSIKIFSVGDIQKSLTIDYPFDVVINVPTDSLSKSEYSIERTDDGFKIINLYNDLNYNFKGNSTVNHIHDLPFDILNFDKSKFIEYDNNYYELQLNSPRNTVKNIFNNLTIEKLGKESHILKLSYRSPIKKYSENILNQLIFFYNQDGINDRQMIHKRTIDFVNKRFEFLSLELDSIEIEKQIFKVDNNLVDFSTSSSFSLQESFQSEQSIFSIENQISITNLLISSLNETEFELLPANIGIDNTEINSFIVDYNSRIIERKKLILSAGLNNPAVKQLNELILDSQSNIISSLINYQNQLKLTKQKLSSKSKKIEAQVSNLPEKEKNLRSIERTQQIKEALYLFLLQKREEAEVSFAVTEPSIKVIEYASSSSIPVTPKSNIIYLGSLLLGLFIPYGVFYLLFLFNNKLYSKDDLLELNLNAPIISEIPEIDETYKILQSSNERSILAESFRILSSNLNFIIPKNINGGKVIISTSTIKGEGKTFTALNLALTYSSLNKKVLLVGADLHNPQIHKYLNLEKSVLGLTNYLIDNNFDWKSSLINANSDLNCDIMLGGVIPPNPAQLLTNGNLDQLIDEAKAIYDFIIVDTPPSLLVSDTLSMTHLSDVVLFVTRCNHTDKEVLNFIRDIIDSGKVKNVGLVLNGLGATNSYGYGYAYNYSYKYGYGYKYSYNYGYGYGYESDDGDNPSS